ncbi:hypothetical protein KIN20_025692 [Parelaphostrongylus tenuis]|uniref:Uncharacterized protein n=1 Tax=Parelaphostrongylus tenuis TaxID=148309 RepID=A0AAD5MZR0_PARTN|nr:hypothetical protein KIN20_025692 [Parelaphostrongylus tenuis]
MDKRKLITFVTRWTENSDAPLRKWVEVCESMKDGAKKSEKKLTYAKKSDKFFCCGYGASLSNLVQCDGPCGGLYNTRMLTVIDSKRNHRICGNCLNDNDEPLGQSFVKSSKKPLTRETNKSEKFIDELRSFETQSTVEVEQQKRNHRLGEFIRGPTIVTRVFPGAINRRFYWAYTDAGSSRTYL